MRLYLLVLCLIVGLTRQGAAAESFAGEYHLEGKQGKVNLALQQDGDRVTGSLLDGAAVRKLEGYLVKDGGNAGKAAFGTVKDAGGAFLSYFRVCKAAGMLSFSLVQVRPGGDADFSRQTTMEFPLHPPGSTESLNAVSSTRSSKANPRDLVKRPASQEPGASSPPVTQAIAPVGKNIAVVMGVSNYLNYAVLDYAGDDAQRVARALKALDYSVALRAVDAASGDHLDCADALKALRLTAASAREGDTLLFYFAGHGGERDGRDYLLLSDTDPDRFAETALPLQGGENSLESVLANCRASRRVLIIDACRASARGGGAAGFEKGVLQSHFRDLVEVVARRAPEGMQVQSAVLYACSPGQRSREEDKDKAGVFTLRLAAALAQDGDLTLGSVFRYVSDNMPAELRGVQTPMLSPPEAASMMLGSGSIADPLESKAAEGRKMLAGRRWTEAESIFRELLRQKPGEVIYMLGLGQALYWLSKYGEAGDAVALFKDSAQKAPAGKQGAECRLWLAKALLWSGKKQEAETAARDGLAMDPDSGLLKFALARTLDAENRATEAEALYREAEPYLLEAVRLRPTDAACQDDLGNCLNNEGKYAEAEPHLREAVRLRPTDAACQDDLGRCLYDQQRYAEAEPYHRQAVLLEPTNAVYQNDLGACLNDQAKFAEADTFCRQAVRLDPKNASCQDNLGVCLAGLKKYPEAEPYYREAVRLEPKEALYEYNLGVCLAGLKKYPEAEPYLREAVRLEPTNPLYQDNLGDCLLHQGRAAGAERYHRQAVLLEPTNAGYQNDLGVCLGNLKRYAEAEPYFREAVRLEPKEALYEYNLGLCLDNLKRDPEAEPYYREAMRLQPKNPMYQGNLGNCLNNEGNYAEAEPLLRQAVLLEPTDPTYQDNLGGCLYNLKRYAEAEPYFREAVRLEPTNAHYNANLRSNENAQGLP